VDSLVCSKVTRAFFFGVSRICMVPDLNRAAYVLPAQLQ
jgi:hypothetical protein